MVQHIHFLGLKAGVQPEQVENLMVETRIRLLKISEIMNLRVGKRIDAAADGYQVFFAFDTESLAKLRVAEDEAVYIKFRHQILERFVERETALNFEMEPGKDIAYS
ncbi:MAG: hypothetical protein LBK60_12265 [Verrucomicrobiales bacterium]|jgi:hypothetical protein|nr:hypothetical protein [Verrucomicrobiales bacterium]